MPLTRTARPWPAALRCVVAAAAITLGCSGQPAAPAIDPSDAPPTDTTADEVLARMTAAYRDADSYFDNAEYRETFMRRNENHLMEPPSHQVSAAFERPNRFRITRRVPEVDGPALAVVAASDGERLTATISDLPKQRLETDATTELTAETLAPDPMLREALLPVPLENLFPQLDLLLATDERPPRLLADARARLLGSREVDGKSCYRVELDRPSGKYVLWIDQTTATLRRVDVPTANLRKQLDPDGAMLDWRLWIDLRDATLGGTMEPSVFRPEPPAGAQMVEQFSAASN